MWHSIILKKNLHIFYLETNLLVHPLSFICHCCFISFSVFPLSFYVWWFHNFTNGSKFYCLLFLALKIFLFHAAYLCINFSIFLLLPVIFNFHCFWSCLSFSPCHLPDCLVCRPYTDISYCFPLLSFPVLHGCLPFLKKNYFLIMGGWP